VIALVVLATAIHKEVACVIVVAGTVVVIEGPGAPVAVDDEVREDDIRRVSETPAN
jgi:hypothetical protein